MDTEPLTTHEVLNEIKTYLTSLRLSQIDARSLLFAYQVARLYWLVSLLDLANLKRWAVFLMDLVHWFKDNFAFAFIRVAQVLRRT